MNDLILVHSTDICHHGVKGQSWGKRQYQYDDGSLTPLGREHYGVSKKEFGKKEQRQYLNKNGKLNAAGREHYENVRKEAMQKIRKYKNDNDDVWKDFAVERKASRIGSGLGLASAMANKNSARGEGAVNAWRGAATGRRIGVIANISRHTIGKVIIKRNEKKKAQAEKILKAFGDTKASDVTKKKGTGGK